MKPALFKLISIFVILSLLLNTIPAEMVAAKPVQPQTASASAGMAVAIIKAAAKPNLATTPSLGEVVEPSKAAQFESPLFDKTQIITTTVNPTGGTITSKSGDFSVEFSPNFTAKFKATLQPVQVESAAMPQMGFAGLAYTLSAVYSNGTPIKVFALKSTPAEQAEKQINANFTITATYSAAGIDGLDESSLGVYMRDPANGQWQRLPSLLNAEVKQVIAQGDRPGQFAVFGRLSTAANPPTTGNVKLVLDPDDNVGHVVWPGVGEIWELPYNVKLALAVRDQLAVDRCSVDVLLTREVAKPDFLSPSFRAQQAVNFGVNVFVTFAFNTFHGYPWGVEGDGGVEGWARLGHADDYAFTNKFFIDIQKFTGRPRRAIGPNRYGAFESLPGTYAHIEVLFLDHNYDWPVIRDGFDLLKNAAYTAVRAKLDALGATCGTTSLPLPPSAERLKQLRDLGYQNYQRYGADPVSFSTGNHVVTRNLFALPGQGADEFKFGLVYNSQDDRDGYFGHSWSAPIAYAQRYQDESITVTLADGRTYYFTPNGSGYTSPDDLKVTLTRTDSGWQWVELDGTTMVFREGENGFAVLTELRNRHGDAETFEYDFNSPARPQLLRVTTTAGQTVEFSADKDGHITQIKLPDGRLYHFEYTNGNLTKITDPRGNFYRYEYDSRNRIVKQWDSENIMFLQNEYDDRNRVIKQVDAGGAQNSISYAAGVTTYTDNLGHVTQYFYDDQSRVTGTQDATGAITQMQYDAADNLTHSVDALGHAFDYTYDANFNLLTETGPEGYSVTYTYNQYNDLTSVTDNGGASGAARTTTFTVNAKGDIEAVHYPDGSQVGMTYDSHGNLLTMTNENGFTTHYNYDATGNLTQINDPLGFKTTYTYDAAGQVLSMTDANGHVVTFEYDGNGNVTKIVDPKGQSTTFEYDKNDNLVTMTDRRGGTWKFTYDDDLKLASETDPEGHVTKYAYDPMYNLANVTDSRGNATRYTYTDRYEVKQIVAADGGVTTFSYDAAGSLVSLVDALNHETRFEYNGLKQRTAQIDALGNRTTMAYDVVGRLTELTNPRGAKTAYQYDLRNHLATATDALNGLAAIEYDAAGNPVTFTDANGHITRLEYDALNRLIKSTDAANYGTRFTLDGVGNLLKSTDALGRETLYQYDVNDNLASIQDALGQVTNFGYTAEDNLASIIDARGNTTAFDYNLDGQMVQMTEAGGQVSRFAYDPAHNLAQFTNAKGNAWQFSYDALNHRTSETDPLGNTTKYGFDLLGRTTKMTDALGVSTGYDYDALNRLVSVIQNVSSAAADAQTNVTTGYKYDEAGNLIAITDANGHVTRFDYDLLDHVTSEQNALGNFWRYTYDPVGNLLSRLDANGAQTDYTYTVLDQLAQVTYPDNSSITYEYDAVGNQLSADASLTGKIANQYDALNRLIASTDAAGKMVGYAYDAAGNQTGLTYPDGKTLTYEYDQTNYLASLTDPEGNAFQIARDATHNATLIQYPNQTQASYQFDAAERLTALANTRNNNELINSFAYTLDKVGNRIKTAAIYRGGVAESLNGGKLYRITTAYQYDPLYRLTRSSDSAGVTNTYTYDAVGNRLKLATSTGLECKAVTYNYSYDAINALTTISQGSAWRDLSKVTQFLGLFVKQVQQQSGQGIDADTAAALIKTANGLLGQINAENPDQQTLDKALDNLGRDIQQALARKLIKNKGIAQSLQAKLNSAREANHKSAAGKPELIHQYSYDQNGNRTQDLFRPGQGNMAEHGRWFSIDYQYDFENRLVRVSQDPGRQAESNPDLAASLNHPSPSQVVMRYDAYGRLFERSSQPPYGENHKEAATRFVYAGLDPIAEYVTGKGSDDQSASQHHETAYTNYYRADGRILSMVAPHPDVSHAENQTAYFHYDGLNSATALTDQRGRLTQAYRYADFGAPLPVKGGLSSESANLTNHYTYTGQDWNAAANLYHFYAREYDPSTGTWLQQDPYRGNLYQPNTVIGRYSYVSSNPILYIDLYGYWGTNISLQIGASGGAGVGPTGSIGLIGLEVEFPGWDPADWRIGGTLLNVQGGGIYGAFVAGGGDLSINVYGWDRGVAIPGPLTTCTGIGGTLKAGAGAQISGGGCSGDGKTGGEFTLGLTLGGGGGVYGYTTIGGGPGKTVSPREIWNWASNTDVWKWLTTPNQTSVPSNCGCTPPPEINELLKQGYSIAEIKGMIRQSIYQGGMYNRKGAFAY